MVIASIDPWSVRVDWTVFNRSAQPLQLDQLDLLVGKLTGTVDPAKNRALVSGLHSWDGAGVARLQPATKIESYYTSLSKP